MEQRGQPTDLVSSVAREFPLRVIGELFGVPEQDRGQFVVWAEGFLSSSETMREDARRCRGQMTEYLRGLIAQRSAHPAGDLLSEIITSKARFTDEEVLARGLELMAGGFETTAAVIGSVTWYLLTHPEHWQYLLDHPEAIPATVEELLRTTRTGSTDGLPRLAVTDVALAGVTIREGDLVVVARAAANLDPAVFPHPETVDLGRENTHLHLTFGYGPHRCIGAALARVELQEYLRALTTRFPALRLAIPAKDVQWRHDSLVWRVRSLPVAW
jgi:nocardicin N-oxygenase